MHWLRWLFSWGNAPAPIPANPRVISIFTSEDPHSMLVSISLLNASVSVSAHAVSTSVADLSALVNFSEPNVAVCVSATGYTVEE